MRILPADSCNSKSGKCRKHDLLVSAGGSQTPFLYLTQRMNIMPRPKHSDDDPLGLRFDFLLPEKDKPVLTGHANGVITLNAFEADVVYRETTRVNMGENYRTLLGHFRHESGHFYFNLIQHLHPELLDELRHFWR